MRKAGTAVPGIPVPKQLEVQLEVQHEVSR